MIVLVSLFYEESLLPGEHRANRRQFGFDPCELLFDSLLPNVASVCSCWRRCRLLQWHGHREAQRLIAPVLPQKNAESAHSRHPPLQTLPGVYGAHQYQAAGKPAAGCHLLPAAAPKHVFHLKLGVLAPANFAACRISDSLCRGALRPRRKSWP